MAAGILLTEMQNTHFGLGSCSQASLSVLSLCGINLRYVAFPLPLVLALSPAVVFSLPAGEGDSFPLQIPPVHESLQPAKHKDNVYTVHVKYFRQLLSALCIEKEESRNLQFPHNFIRGDRPPQTPCCPGSYNDRRKHSVPWRMEASHTCLKELDSL